MRDKDNLLDDMPNQDLRSPYQTYVHRSWEPPPYEFSETPASRLNSFFNASMSYRMDAEFSAPFGKFIKIKNHPEGAELDQLIQNFGNNNIHLAVREGNGSLLAQMVSHCNTESGRENLTTMIETLLKVDVYGNCGPLKCIKNGELDCNELVGRTNKMYLAFENSICKDYVTEKVFKMLPYNIIPIVFNGARMSDVAPTHSYINVMDYGSVRELVDDIKRIADDDALFASYFWWRDYYQFQVNITDSLFITFCLHILCRQQLNPGVLQCASCVKLFTKKKAKQETSKILKCCQTLN